MSMTASESDGMHMTASDAFEKLLRAFRDYYDVNRESPAVPFAAEAVYHSHEEQYFLVRAARIAESESHEYIFFAVEKSLDAERLRMLADAAWNAGTERVRPHKDHRNSDIALMILTDSVTPDALALAPKLRFYRSYRFTLHGWSHFRLALWDGASGKAVCNRQGKQFAKLIRQNLT